jgi:DNA polymerase V
MAETYRLFSLTGEQPILVIFYEGTVPAGFPSPADDYVESPLDLRDYLVRNPTATFVMRAKGDSMREIGILDGDLLVVDRSVKPTSGSIVVAALNGEFTVKTLRRVGGHLQLEAANPSYEALPVEAGAELHIFGVVLHAIRSFRSV